MKSIFHVAALDPRPFAFAVVLSGRLSHRDVCSLLLRLLQDFV